MANCIQTEYQRITQFQQLKKTHEHLNTNGVAFQMLTRLKIIGISPFFLFFVPLQEQPYVRKDRICPPL